MKVTTTVMFLHNKLWFGLTFVSLRSSGGVEGKTLMTEWEAEALNDDADGAADVPEYPLLKEKGNNVELCWCPRPDCQRQFAHLCVCLDIYHS